MGPDVNEVFTYRFHSVQGQTPAFKAALRQVPTICGLAIHRSLQKQWLPGCVTVSSLQGNSQ